MLAKYLPFSLILISISILSVFSNIISQRCLYATPNKPPGSYIDDTGQAEENITPFHSELSKHRETCKNQCRINDKCYAVSFINNNCSFYNTNNFTISHISNIQYSLWNTCGIVFQPDDRCKGYYLTYIGEEYNVTGENLLASYNADQLVCRNKCFQNPFCGFINRVNNTCDLISPWPTQKFKIEGRPYYELDVWTCVNDYIETLEPQTDNPKPIDEKCTGYWKVTNRNKTLTKDQSKGLNFQTQAYINCLEECNLHPHCSIAWFSLKYFTCILKDIEPSDEHLPFDNMKFIEFEWICVKNDSKIQPLNEDEKRYQKLRMNCYTIVDNYKLFIGADECGRCPQESKFVSCNDTRPEPDMHWNIRDSCLVNQSYWGFSPTKTHMNLSGVIVDNLIKVFTGLQIYWIAFSDGDLSEANYHQCRHFNASRPSEILHTSEIIPKSGWYGRPARGSLNDYTEPPTQILITASQQPLHSCRTIAACMDILRSLQQVYFDGSGASKFSDIPYNFMIDDYGHIYECRGWKHACAAIYPYNGVTICLGFIGWFAYKYPTERYLNSVKKFIDYSVKNGFVNSNYSVFVHQDLTTVKIKRNLKIAMKNLYRYRGFLPEDCSNIPHLIIYLNLFIFIVILPIIYAFYKFFSFKSACSNCKFLSETKNDPVELFPQNDISNEIQNSKMDYLTNINQYIICEKSFIQPKKFSKIVKIIKVWFFNRFLGALNARHVENNFINFLQCTIKQESSIFIYQIEVNENCNVITVVSNTGTINFLKQLINKCSCICMYFHIEKIDLSNIPIDIQIIH